MNAGDKSEVTGKKPKGCGAQCECKAAGSGRPHNVGLEVLMRACATAFMPDGNTLVESLERCPNRGALLETARDMVRSLAEYGAVAGAHLLKKAAGGDEDAQVAAIMESYKGIGAPGDWGYETPRGKTWYALLQAYDKTMDEREAAADGEEASHG